MQWPTLKEQWHGRSQNTGIKVGKIQSQERKKASKDCRSAQPESCKKVSKGWTSVVTYQ